MKIISYAQNLEDVMLWRALQAVENGFYIDVGACSPQYDSVTRLFSKQGWKGINVEPNPLLCEAFTRERVHDINLCVALGEELTNGDLYVFDNVGLSTLDADLADSHVRDGLKMYVETVPILTLEKIWDDYVPADAEVHFLKIDVEGMELSVLRGNDWQKNRPWILLIEAIAPDTHEAVHHRWEPLLLSADYHYAYTDGINRFYVAAERGGLMDRLKHPPNVFDDFEIHDPKLAELKRQSEWLQDKIDSMVIELSSVRQVLEARDEELASIRQTLVDKDRELASLKSALQRKDAEIRALLQLTDAR